MEKYCIENDFAAQHELAEKEKARKCTHCKESQVELLTLQERYNAQEKKLEDYKGDMAFIKRWVQRVYDKETTLEEFYGVLRYHTPLKPVEAALALAGGESECDCHLHRNQCCGICLKKFI